MDSLEKLNSSLQCHVCFEEYKVNQKIWQCRSGHSVCQSCQGQLDECPFCKAPYEGTRNYAVEEIVREFHSKEASYEADAASTTQKPSPSAPEYENVATIGGNQEQQRVLPSLRNSATGSSSVDTIEFNDVVVVQRPQRVVSKMEDPAANLNLDGLFTVTGFQSQPMGQMYICKYSI